MISLVYQKTTQNLEKKRYTLPLDINFISFILRSSVSKLHENAAAVLREDGVGLKLVEDR